MFFLFRLCSFCALFFGSLFIGMRPVHALTVAPTIFDFALFQNEQRAFDVAVRNDDKISQTVYVTFQDVLTTPEGALVFAPVTPTSTLARWITVHKPYISLSPGGEAVFHFSVRIPSQASAGGYQAAVFFSHQRPTVVDGENRFSGSRIGAFIFANVAGDRLYSHIEIKHVEAVPMDFDTQHSVIELAQYGTAHIVPRGEVRWVTLFGNVLASQKFNPQEQRLLGHTSRFFETKLERSVWLPVRVSFVFDPTLGLDPFVIWLVPTFFKGILIVFIIVGLGGLGFVRYHRRTRT